MEAELRESEALYREIAENAGDMVFLYELQDERYVYISPSVERLLGYTPAEVYAIRSLAGSLAPESRDTVMAGFRRRVQAFLAGDASARTWNRRRELVRKDGSRLQVEMVSCLIPKPGQPGALRILTMIRDLTEIQESRAAMERLQDELRQTQRLEALGQLAGGVAHDINNLMMSVLSFAEILDDRLPEGDPLRGFVATMRKAGQRSTGIIRQLLAFARKEAPQVQALDLNERAGEVVRSVAPLIEASIEVNFAPRPGLWSVCWDPVQIDQVLMNLVLNARDAVQPRGEILVTLANADLDGAGDAGRTGRYVVLTVADTGVGMDSETLARIYEPFFTTKAPGKGTGLGLSIAFGIVQQAGGFIQVHSESGRGTVFQVHLPACEAAAWTVPDPAGRPRAAAPWRVLVAEDNDFLRLMLPLMLERLGCTAAVAAGGREALELCGREEPAFDLVLTDVIMPGLSGLGLRDELARLRPDLKVVFMSGHADAMQGHGLVPPGTHLITKPFTTAELGEFLARAMDGRGGPGVPAREGRPEA
jgi:PAS domain S-box-containing protein